MNVGSLKKLAFKGVMWSLFDKVINQLGNILLLIYLSRILSPTDFGLIAMLAVFLAIAQSLVDSGFSQALIQRSKKVTEKDLSTVFYVNLVISVFIYIILFIFSPVISDFFQQPELINLSRVLFVVIILNSIALVPRTKLIIEVDFRTQSIINAISMIVTTILTVYMVKKGYGYWSLVGMNIIKSLTNAILLIMLSKWYPKWLFSIRSFTSLFSFGSNLLIAGVLSTVVQNFYLILIGRYFNVVQVGYFQQGYNYTNMLASTISSVTQGVTYPIMTSIQEDKERLVNIYEKVMGVITLITFPLFIGFAAISREFVIIFLGEKWIPIIPIIIILSFSRLITPISSLNLTILNARGRSDLFLKTDLSKLPMTIASLFIAIPYGIVGVAIAQLVTTFISFFINSYYPGKLFGYGWKEQLWQLCPIFIISLVMYFTVNLIELDDIAIQMCVKIAAGTFTYVFLCWAFRVKSFFYVIKLLIR
ncbi:lipopolysaccharide biosynthesis protein [Vibrio lentus]|uniref:lipopolysaccharide biosynthesis protein n=1 Tax=Vibrio lentus TaxID=136468 RepID=UPI000C852FDD|nr:lipopolysaccharide biosynthesis protein [Vibrio lentus]MCC4816392.1 lipopolysaccharide biosynthesis protein [Vibrio lentus]PMG69731.1 lipopolysaccharide biosynthesis protein [Vibrio lentus]PMK90292.1 lipopolysaccharide biosynthesis protein [Vibrio lentus]PML20385.1 lipopolysaccharide biosynthesis protein [Vibrio lentus]PMM25357.1 lipopolysaccharide biosynthesis protein [Vibrio lentus]